MQNKNKTKRTDENKRQSMCGMHVKIAEFKDQKVQILAMESATKNVE